MNHIALTTNPDFPELTIPPLSDCFHHEGGIAFEYAHGIVGIPASEDGSFDIMNAVDIERDSFESNGEWEEFVLNVIKSNGSY